MATTATVAACGDSVPLYSFPTQMCGETAIQGAPDSSKTDAPSLTLATSDNQRIFWVEDDYNTRGGDEALFYSGSLDGGDAIKIASDKTMPAQIEVDDQEVFWALDGTQIKAVDKLGGTPRVVARIAALGQSQFGGQLACGGNGYTCPFRFALDASYVYYGENGTLRRVDKRQPDSSPTTLATGLVGNIAADDSAVYWVQCAADFRTTSVMKLAKSSSAPITLASSIDGADCITLSQRLVLDDKAVYWATALSVLSVPKAGGPMTTINGQTNGFVTSLAVTSDALYWVTAGSERGAFSPETGHHSLVRSSKTALATPQDLIPTYDDHYGENDDSCVPLNVFVDRQSLYWVVTGGVLRRLL